MGECLCKHSINDKEVQVLTIENLSIVRNSTLDLPSAINSDIQSSYTPEELIDKVRPAAKVVNEVPLRTKQQIAALEAVNFDSRFRSKLEDCAAYCQTTEDELEKQLLQLQNDVRIT